jgi:hypothetical protein
MNLTKENQLLILKWVTYVLVGFYMLNLFTPLRLHVDTLRYFAIRECIEFGCPPESFAMKDYLPFGYTALLIGLSKIGILKSFAIVLFNCIFLFASLYFIAKLFQIDKNIWMFLVLVLLNWTTIKFVVHPLSEMQYLYFSVLSLYFFNCYTLNKKFIQLILSFFFAALAFVTRSVAITLVAALMTGLLWEFRQQLISLFKKNKLVIIGSILSVIIVVSFSKQLGLNHYVDVLIKQFTEGVGYKDILRWHFIELTEISTNLPFTKVVEIMPIVIRIVFLILGVITLLSIMIHDFGFRLFPYV